MPFSVDWYIPRRVLYMRVWGDITPEEIVHQDKQVLRFLNEGQQPVYLVGDDRHVRQTHLSVTNLRSVMKSVNHPALGATIMLGKTSPMATLLTRILFIGAGVRYQRVDTIEATLEVLRNLDSTLQWGEANPSVFSMDNEPL